MTAFRPVAVWVLVLAPYALYFVLPNRFWFDVAVQIAINAVVAVGLNLLVGMAGQISLGHAGFFAIGAYAAVLAPKYLGAPTATTIPIALAVTAAVAFAIGRPLLKLRGHYLAMTTLAFGILVFIALNNTGAVTGGPDGTPVPRLALGEAVMPSSQNLRGARIWYLVFYTLLIIAVVVAIGVERSPLGRALRAVRDSEIATRFCGIDVEALKVWVFVLSALYAAFAGVLAAHYSEFTAPDRADFMYSTILITMVVLGGLGSTWGAVVGAIILTALPQVLVVFHQYESAALGAILILCMVFFRRGLVPTLATFINERRERHGH